MDNTFYNFIDAVKEADSKLEEGQLLEDSNGEKWDISNLYDEDYANSREEGGKSYWCVGYDGSIGYTDNDGVNVDWLFRVYYREDDDKNSVIIECDKCRGNFKGEEICEKCLLKEKEFETIE